MHGSDDSIAGNNMELIKATFPKGLSKLGAGSDVITIQRSIQRNKKRKESVTLSTASFCASGQWGRPMAAWC